jgi:thiopurine S-methyltransferase
MTDRDNALWLQLWRERCTDFHQLSANPLLVRFWPGLGLAADSRVLVPLCGKSLDMLWLAARGHHVIGIELSPVAVRAFFKENRLRATRQRSGHFTLWQHGRISILCGDYFAMSAADLGRIDTIYDRAALTALPAAIRADYVAQLRRLVPLNASVFLLTVEDSDASIPAQAPGIDQELAMLYRSDFDIELTHAESGDEHDPELPHAAPLHVEHKLYRLTAKTGAMAPGTGR